MSSLEQDPSSLQVNWSHSDTQLIIQAQKGHEAAFEILYRRHYNRLCIFVVRMVGDNEVGCELTQEAFLKAWQTLPSLRDPKAFLSWLYRIAKNLVYDLHRQTSRHIHCESYDKETWELERISIPGPEDQVEAEEHLKQALLRIPLEYRTCLILYHLEGWSKQQVAELLGIKESSVGTYLSYGLKELRHVLKENVVSENGASVIPEDSASKEGSLDQ